MSLSERLVGHSSVRSKTKSIRPRPRPVWNRSCYKTAVSDPKTVNKTAELSQRRLRDAPNIRVHWKVLRVLTTHLATFPQMCNGLLFRSILTMCVQNLKFVALPVPEIIGYSKKFGQSLDSLRPRSIFSQNFKGLLFEWTLWIYLPNLKLAALSVPEIIRGYAKNLGTPCIRPRSIFSQIFNWLLFGWTLWIHLPNLTFVALHIPEIIGGTSKIWRAPGFAHAPYSPKFLKGFWSHGPCEYTCQVWSLSLYPFLR